MKKVCSSSRVVAVLLVLWSVAMAHGAELKAKQTGPDEKQMLELLRNRNREIDPFGCAMNPAKKAALVIDVPAPPKEEAVKTSLEMALQGLTVNGVNPLAKTLLIGARRIRVGEPFIYRHNDMDMRLAVHEVSLAAVTIADLNTGEVATHQLDIGPSLQSGARRSPTVRFHGPLTIR